MRMALGAAALWMLYGCQTTLTGFAKERSVDVNETKIVMPAELSERDGFKIIGAKILETGSHRRETVYFTGGFFSYDRYFLGGFDKRSARLLRNSIAYYFSNPSDIRPVKVGRFATGKVFYTTFTAVEEGRLGTCFIMTGDYGKLVTHSGVTGTEGITSATYCKDGDVPNLEEAVVPWMAKIAMRQG